MPTRDSQHTSGALHRLRRRWFAPTQPLAVDDEAHWPPVADPDEPPVPESDLVIPPATSGQT
jgi:hypothetical protein